MQTYQSRRNRVSAAEVCDVTMASTQKSRRRSSLAPGRIRLLHGSTVGGELHQVIDCTLPQEERLAQLTRACLEYTLRKLEEEMSDSEMFPAFKSGAEDAVLKVIEEMQDNQVFLKACHKEKYVPNPINLQMDTAIAHLEHQANRLTKEADRWNELVQTTEDKLKQEQQKSATKEIADTALPMVVRDQAASYLCHSLDHNALLRNLATSVKTTTLLIDEHSKGVHLLKRAHQTAEGVVKKQSDNLKQVTFSGIPNFHSPRTLVNNVISLEGDS